jgi:hypothetical protein
MKHIKQFIRGLVVLWPVWLIVAAILLVAFATPEALFLSFAVASFFALIIVIYITGGAK